MESGGDHGFLSLLDKHDSILSELEDKRQPIETVSKIWTTHVGKPDLSITRLKSMISKEISQDSNEG